MSEIGLLRKGTAGGVDGRSELLSYGLAMRIQRLNDVLNTLAVSYEKPAKKSPHRRRWQTASFVKTASPHLRYPEARLCFCAPKKKVQANQNRKTHRPELANAPRHP